MKMKKIDTDQEQASKHFGLATQGGPHLPKAFSQEPVEQAIAELDSNFVAERMENCRRALNRVLHGRPCLFKAKREIHH
jgi:hypothetical protein